MSIISSLQNAKERSVARGSFNHVRLNSPASAIDFLRLDAAIGGELPSKIKTLLSIHNGESGVIGLLGAQIYLMSSEDIVRCVSELSHLLEASVDSEVGLKRFEQIPIAVFWDEIALFRCDSGWKPVAGEIVLLDPISGLVRPGFDSIESMLSSFDGKPA